jgi:hypothetical protein
VTHLAAVEIHKSIKGKDAGPSGLCQDAVLQPSRFWRITRQENKSKDLVVRVADN